MGEVRVQWRSYLTISRLFRLCQLLLSLLKDFLLWTNSSGSVLQIKGNSGAVSGATPTGLSLGSGASKAPDPQSAVSVLTSDFHKFSPFSSPLEDGHEKCGGEDLVPEVAFLSHHMRPPPTGGTLGQQGGAEYNPYYQLPSDYYSSLTNEQSLESQDSSTLSSPSDCLAQAGGLAECSPCLSSTSLFQFPIGKILEEEVAAGQERELPSFYESMPYPNGGEGASGEKGAMEILSPASPLQLHSPGGRQADKECRAVEQQDEVRRYCGKLWGTMVYEHASLAEDLSADYCYLVLLFTPAVENNYDSSDEETVQHHTPIPTHGEAEEMLAKCLLWAESQPDTSDGTLL
ncbi:UNVERIFIED_CONTAM: hypothetical protein FKN15_077625 [Acipenser sinensis]